MSIDPVSIAIQVALIAASMAISAAQRIKGPRLDSLDVTVADYGTPIPRVWGVRRAEGVPVIWAEKLHEVTVTTKSKGGKYDNQKYYGTFAALLSDVPIEGVTRIWMDKHLVFDATGGGPMSVAAALSAVERASAGSEPKGSKGSSGDLPPGTTALMRTYLGDEEQMPDPRMEAWCDARYGSGSCPAYRGSAYIVFEELPLAPFGNRIPQLSVEFVGKKAVVLPYETRESTVTSAYNSFAIAGTWAILYNAGPSPIEWWDLPSRTRVGAVVANGGYPFLNTNLALETNGTTYWYGPGLVGSSGRLKRYSCALLGATIEFAFDPGPSYIGVGPARIFGSTTYCGHPDPGFIEGVSFITHAQCARDFFMGPNSQVWGVFQPSGSSNQFRLRNMATGSEYDFTSLVTRGGIGSPRGCYVPSTNRFFVSADGKFYLIDATTMTLASSGVAAWPEATDLTGPSSFWYLTSQYSLIDGSLIRTIAPYDWVTETLSASIYDPISNAILSKQSNLSHVTWRYLDRIGGGEVLLRDIVTDVAGWCGVGPIDATALTQPVAGYSVAQGPGKDMIAPLLEIHDSIARPHDGGVQFIQRGASPSGSSIATADFVRDESTPRYAAAIAQDSDLPRRTVITFADVARDQQKNTAQSQRQLALTDGRREETIDLSTMAGTATEMQRLADRRFRREINQREVIGLGLTRKHLSLEPGDVRSFLMDGVSRIAMARKIILTKGHLKVEWERDAPTLHTLPGSIGAPMDGRDAETIVIPAPARGFVLDTPLLTDSEADARPLLHAGAAPYGNGAWVGANIYEGDGVYFTDAVAAIDSSNKASWGVAGAALPGAVPWLWDRGNVLIVQLLSGTLVSVTEAEVMANPALNLVLLGDEAMNFTTATLGGDGLWTLSGFLRGRRGTEWAVGGHVAAETLVLAGSLDTLFEGLSDVGTALYFKATSIGRNPADSPRIDVPFKGRSLMPYAPARIAWTTGGTDLTGTITRRTRIGGAWVGGTTIPLAEAAEKYEVDIYAGAVLKRTIAVSGGNVFTYTAAMMTADGNVVAVPPPVKLFQISDAVGRGFELAA